METPGTKDAHAQQTPANNSPVDWKKNSKYAFGALAGGAIASGAIFAWGKERIIVDDPEKENNKDQGQNQEVKSDETPNDHHLNPFEQVFAQKRHELGKGELFEYNGNWYTTYYKEEWEALSLEEKKAALRDMKTGVEQPSGDLTSPETPKPVQPVFTIATQVDDSMEIETALFMAREEGADLFEWHDDLYLTYAQEELDQMSPEQQAYYAQICEEHHAKVPFTYAIDNPFITLTYPIIQEDMIDVDGDGIDDHVIYTETAPGEPGNSIIIDTTGDGHGNIIIEDTTGNGLFDTMKVDHNDDGIYTTYHKNTQGEWEEATNSSDEDIQNPDFNPNSPEAANFLL